MDDYSSKAVFLSYASQDTAAARRIAEALRESRIEVWFDQSELRGGEAWDRKIRQQIQGCTLFLPIISASTEQRGEGYFRREWKLAVERTDDMAEDVAFLVPVVIDATPESIARVPAKFRTVQWTRLPDGMPTPEFAGQVKRLLQVEPVVPKELRHAARSPGVEIRRAGQAVAERRKWRAWTTGLAGVAVIAALALFGLRWLPGTPRSGDLDTRKVAVLPFANLDLGNESTSEHFAVGLSDSIRNALEQNAALKVVGRTSSAFYRNQAKPIAELARDLKVGSVIEGSVQRVGTRLRISVQFTHAADSTQVWSESFERELTTENIFAVQDEISGKIAARLMPVGAPAMAERRPTANLAAYDAYLQGRQLLGMGFSTRERIEACAQFRRAVELDPGFAEAWARLAYVLAWIDFVGGLGEGDDLEPAQQALRRAESLNPNLAEVHLARTMVFRVVPGGAVRALAAIEAAEKLQPASGEILVERGQVLRALGRFEESLAVVQRSLELDPRNPHSHNSQALLLSAMGRYREANAAYDRAIALGGGVMPAINKAWAQAIRQGDFSAARETMAKIPPDRFDAWTRARVAGILCTAGDFAAAAEAARAMETPVVTTQLGVKLRDLELARVLEQSGDEIGARRCYADAVAQAEDYLKRHPKSWRIQPALAHAYAGAGRLTEAREAVRKCLELVPPTEWLWMARDATLPMVVDVLSRLGEMEQAIEIARPHALAGGWRRNYLLRAPEFFFARKNPGFLALAELAPL